MIGDSVTWRSYVMIKVELMYAGYSFGYFWAIAEIMIDLVKSWLAFISGMHICYILYYRVQGLGYLGVSG